MLNHDSVEGDNITINIGVAERTNNIKSKWGNLCIRFIISIGKQQQYKYYSYINGITEDVPLNHDVMPSTEFNPATFAHYSNNNVSEYRLYLLYMLFKIISIKCWNSDFYVFIHDKLKLPDSFHIGYKSIITNDNAYGILTSREFGHNFESLANKILSNKINIIHEDMLVMDNDITQYIKISLLSSLRRKYLIRVPILLPFLLMFAISILITACMDNYVYLILTMPFMSVYIGVMYFIHNKRIAEYKKKYMYYCDAYNYNYEPAKWYVWI